MMLPKIGHLPSNVGVPLPFVCQVRPVIRMLKVTIRAHKRVAAAAPICLINPASDNQRRSTDMGNRLTRAANLNWRVCAPQRKHGTEQEDHEEKGQNERRRDVALFGGFQVRLVNTPSEQFHDLFLTQLRFHSGLFTLS